MKKIASILTPVLIVAALLVVPLGVQAQVIDVPVDEEIPAPTATDPLPSTGAGTPTTAPDTGFAPSENKVVANLSVFVIGGLLGAGLGYTFIAFKKKTNS